MKVIRERDGEVLYCFRVSGNRFRPSVYVAGKYDFKIGVDRSDQKLLTGVVSG